MPQERLGAVKALLHSVYDQPDTKAVHAQYDKMLDTLTGKLPAVVDHLDRARADVLAFTSFPKEIWRQIWSNNPNVISSPSTGVLDVQHGDFLGCDRSAGRGYLRSVHDSDWLEVRCSCRRWSRPGRGLSRERCWATTMCRSRRSRGQSVVLTGIERSPNTVKAYAHDLKDYFVFLVHHGMDWREVRLEDVGEFSLAAPPAGRPLGEC